MLAVVTKPKQESLKSQLAKYGNYCIVSNDLPGNDPLSMRMIRSVNGELIYHFLSSLTVSRSG